MSAILNKLKESYEASSLKGQIDPYVEKYKDLPTEKKKAVQSAAAFFLVALNLLFILTPQIQSFNTLKDETTNMVNQFELAKEHIRTKDLTKQADENTALLMAELNGRTISEAEIPSFLDQLSDTASKVNLELVELKPMSKVAISKLTSLSPLPQGYSYRGYTLRSWVKYHDLGRFVQILENSETYIDVCSVEVYHGPKQTRSEHQVTLQIVMIQRESINA